MANEMDMGEMIKNMISDPESMAKITSIFNSLGGNMSDNADDSFSEGAGEKSHEESETSQGFGGMDFDISTILKLKGAYDNIMSGDDQKISLLLALRPYLNEKRLESFDKVVKLVRMSKITEILKDLDIDIMNLF